MLTLRKNHSTPSDILNLLTICDPDFVPPLSQRVDLEYYSKRIAQHAARLESWDEHALVGMIATYCNAPDKSRAFITNVSVAPKYRGRGLSKELLKATLHHVQDAGFASIALEVSPHASAARALYEACGFESIAQEPSVLTYHLELR